MSQWHLDILTETRKQLLVKRKREPYSEPLLDAVHHAGLKYRQFNQSYREIYHYVKDSLSHSSNLESWLHNTHRVPATELFTREGKQKLLATRLAWIDHLEKQFRGKT